MSTSIRTEEELAACGMLGVKPVFLNESDGESCAPRETCEQLAVMGRVTGNWMSWVDATNKKLIDRATRLISEIGGMDYKSACIRVFEAMEAVEKQKQSDEKVSVVQYALKQLGK